MRNLLSLSFAFLALAGTATAHIERTIPPSIKAHEAALLARAGPKTRAFVLHEAAAELKHRVVSEASARAAARANGPALGVRAPSDFDGLVFLILTQAASDAEDDLNSMGEIEQMKLQELTDQRSKALETLSNTMKSISDVRKSFADNLK